MSKMSHRKKSQQQGVMDKLKNPRVLLVVLVAIVLLGSSVFALSSLRKPGVAELPTSTPTLMATPSVNPTIEPTVELTMEPTVMPTVLSPDDLSPTTGRAFAGPYKPLCVMIENSLAARPQDGLADADIVYECLMEAKSVTRLFCVFNDTIPNKTGPIRSARTGFLQILSEWNAGYVYFGGPEGDEPYSVVEKIKDMNLKLEVNGLGKHNNLFYRTTDREVPHNAYIDLKKAYELMPEVTKAKHFLFAQGAELPGGTPATEFKVSYNKTGIRNAYVYDAEKDVYMRSVNEVKMMDKGANTQIAVTNVIVQYAPHPYFETSPALHVNIQLIGSGKAVFFLGGKTVEGTWERKDASNITIYKDASGQEISLRPGKTWVHIADVNTLITVQK